LFDSRDFDVACDVDRAIIRLCASIEQSEQRGFAGAVASDQADTFVRMNGEVCTV
jgi:hypothetical protein